MTSQIIIHSNGKVNVVLAIFLSMYIQDQIRVAQSLVLCVVAFLFVRHFVFGVIS